MVKKPTYRDLKKKVRSLERALRDAESASEERLEGERLRGVLEMAGAVCHELNQPMQVLSVYCERFLKEMPKEGCVYAEVENIAKKIERIVEITRKLQRIASYETKEYIEGRQIIDIDRASRAA